MYAKPAGIYSATFSNIIQVNFIHQHRQLTYGTVEELQVILLISVLL